MIKKILIAVLVLAAASYLGYSVWYTRRVNPEQGLVVCVPAGRQKTITQTAEGGEKISTVIGGEEQSCFWTGHIHAMMDLTYCGKHMDLPKDKGDLRGPHTHKELNKMHSPHSPQQVDPLTKDFLDPRPLTVGGFLDAMDIDIKTPCPAAAASTATVMVNGLTKSLDYVWQDDDEIKLEYK